MKRLGFVFLSLLVLSGCQSISKEEYDALNMRADQLQDKADALQVENSALRADLDALSQQVQVEQNKGDIKVTLQEAVLFNSSSFEISKGGRDILKQVVQVLSGMDASKKLNIVGHTDNMPVHRKWHDHFVDNWDLSARRAAEVARYFIWGHGIAPERIAIVGKAHVQPVAGNDTKEGRAMNRRIELFIVSE